MDDWVFYKTAKWELTFVLFPKRCDKSNKLLWLSHEYRGINQLSTYEYSLQEVRWLSKKEFIFGKLSGRI